MASKKKIGFIGLGRMGYPMVKNLLKAGFSVKIYDIDQHKIDDLLKFGAFATTSPEDASKEVEVVISMILDDTVLEEVAFGDLGILAGTQPGTIYADMSTVSVSASMKVAKQAEQKGIPYLRAKVSGSIKPATEGTLTIFASGPEEAYKKCVDVFEALGNKHYYVGAGEEAIYLKLVHSIMVGLTALVIGEAFVFGECGNVDWVKMIDVINNSALNSKLFDYKAPLLKNRDYSQPQSTVDVVAKDIDLALKTAKEKNIPLPLTALAREFFRSMQAKGQGNIDFIGIVELMENMAGISQ